MTNFFILLFKQAIKLITLKTKLMKNLLLSLIIIITVFAACKSDIKPDNQNRDIQLLTDSTVYTNSNIYSDTAVAVQTEPVSPKITESPKAIVKTRRPAKVTARKSPVYTQDNSTVTTTPTVATPPIVTNSGGTENSGTVGSGDNSKTETAATIPQPEKKKGWNKATQGAVIGGAAGAVGGAILSKKKGLGAVIGGVVGAAGGYIIGKRMDKKDNQFVIQ
jgi:hypothetical protein